MTTSIEGQHYVLPFEPPIRSRWRQRPHAPAIAAPTRRLALRVAVVSLKAACAVVVAASLALTWSGIGVTTDPLPATIGYTYSLDATDARPALETLLSERVEVSPPDAAAVIASPIAIERLDAAYHVIEWQTLSAYTRDARFAPTPRPATAQTAIEAASDPEPAPLPTLVLGASAGSETAPVIEAPPATDAPVLRTGPVWGRATLIKLNRGGGALPLNRELRFGGLAPFAVEAPVSAPEAPAAAPPPPYPATVVVQPDDRNLYHLAARLGVPLAAQDRWVEDLTRINALDSRGMYPGNVIRLPARPMP